MKINSAGVLVYGVTDSNKLEVLLVHPGGPFFKNKNAGWWSIPKGLPEQGETLEEAAIRELAEETGIRAEGPLVSLGSIQQKGGKIVHAWALRLNEKINTFPPSNTFEIKWPPKSGKRQAFPEVDKVAWFGLEEAKTMINAAQREFLERLAASLENL